MRPTELPVAVYAGSKEFGTYRGIQEFRRETDEMSNPVVHFEIIGTQPEHLRSYYRELFGWQSDSSPVSEAVSEPDNYGFIERISTPDGVGIPGGIGGGLAYSSGAIFYVGVSDVEEALQRAEQLGGSRVLGPSRAPSGLVIGQFTDPQGNRIGVAAVPVD
jgi:predicted enzyme related to lactoylglutathione lyase